MEKRNSLTQSNSLLPPLQTPPFSLPVGWGVEEVRRSDGSKSDKYYLEPGTGRKFRSLREVQRHLNGERVSRRPRSSALVAYNCPKMSTSSGEESPSKVNWALASPKGDAWNPIIGDTLVSDSVKQQWNKRFMLVMNNDETSAVTPTMEQRPQLMEQPHAAENTQQTLSVEGLQEESGLRRSSRSKKVAYHHQDFLYD